jgi:Holliday junction DNA helicase RuvA
VIAYLRGKVRRATADQVVVETGGVGYLVSIPLSVRQHVPSPGSELELHVHTHVREDQLALFGFSSPQELELFQMLIQVDGVGPKVGLAILGAASMDVLKRAILAEDVAPIRRAQGVGPRTAQKVIIDLKPKLEADAALAAVPRATVIAGNGDLPRQVEEALRGLGYSQQEARLAIEQVDWKSAENVQDALAAALRSLAKR